MLYNNLKFLLGETMPLYEYKCKRCNKLVEALQRIESDPLKECIYCGGEMEKLVSASSFQFKGSGWYITDYKRKDSPAKGDNGKAKSASSAKSNEDRASNVTTK
jgi:putative FmdB family regulatory protein